MKNHLCRPGKDDVDTVASWNNCFNLIRLLSRFVLLASLVYAQTAPITPPKLSICYTYLILCECGYGRRLI